MKLRTFFFCFFCFIAKCSLAVQVYDHTQGYAVNFANVNHDLLIDSPYTWYFSDYDNGATITADVEVIFTVSNFPAKCRVFSRTYHLTGNDFTYDTAVQRGLSKILDLTKQANQPDINPAPAYHDYTGKLFLCAVNPGTHDATVAINTAIGYGVDNTGTQSSYTINGTVVTTSLNIYNWINSNIVFIPYFTTAGAIPYASNCHAVAVICSDAAQIADYPDYPAIQTFVPLGSNSHILLNSSSSPAASDSILNNITSGAANVNDTNITAYGPGLEFIAPATASSWSNGYVAGQIYKIKIGRNCGWWEARYCARMTASNNGVWNIKNGFGLINVTAAINRIGIIIPCQYPTF